MEYKNPKKCPLPITLSNGVTETFASRNWVYIENSVAAASPMLLAAFKSGKLLRRLDAVIEQEQIVSPSLDKTVFIDNIVEIENSFEGSLVSEEEKVISTNEILEQKPQAKTKTKKSKEF